MLTKVTNSHWMRDSGSDLTVGRPHQLHEPPASAASLEQVHLDHNYWFMIFIDHLSSPGPSVWVPALSQTEGRSQPTPGTCHSRSITKLQTVITNLSKFFSVKCVSLLLLQWMGKWMVGKDDWWLTCGGGDHLSLAGPSLGLLPPELLLPSLRCQRIAVCQVSAELHDPMT